MSSNVKIIEVKRSIFEDNDRDAERLRQELKAQGTFLINIMSSPGSGKTTTLLRLSKALKGRLSIGVMEADIDSSVDAETLAQAGVKSIQIHTGGMCHLDADMTRQGLREFGVLEAAPQCFRAPGGVDAGRVTDDAQLSAVRSTCGETQPGRPDVIFLENVGNLVCPAEFDTGAAMNMTILSVPEGDDKPLKYPLMYEVCDLLVVNKIDVLPYFDFDAERIVRNARGRNPDIDILFISARTGEGIDALADYIEKRAKEWLKL